MQYCKTNKMVLPIINRLVKNLDNKYKVFNYIIQNIETKRNTTVLNRLNEYLADKSTKPILYTYDSFLIDYDISDGKDVLREITNIITDNDKYGVTFKVGINYDCMKSFTTFF
jgi:thiol-disulfide isomerase/thioredoxin